MSKSNTMTSGISDILSQNQQNLHQLQQQSRNMTTLIDVQTNAAKTSMKIEAPTLDEAITFGHKKGYGTSISSDDSRYRQHSLQVQRSEQQDPRSMLTILMPTNANPTELLAQRFAAWRSIIRSILIYLQECVSIQDEMVRQHLRLQNAVNFPFFPVDGQQQPATQEEKSLQKFFLPLGSGSVHDLPTIFAQYHGKMVLTASKTSKELNSEVIPRLEDMRRDLLVKIKEIQSLESDFKNSCSKELQETKIRLKAFQEALESSKYGSAKQDPYLAKILLEKQIKKQLTEENFLHEAFNNLQTSGKELEKVVVMEIQNALTTYAKLLGQESQLTFDNLISRLDSGFFGKDPVFEWEYFIEKDPNFIDQDLPMRNVKEIVYKNQNDPFTYEIKSGILERRSKFLKSYSRGYYVLTPSFLHEFKTGDRKKDLVPVISLSLNDCTVAEHSKKGSSDFKFILHTKQNGIIHRGHNWVFRTDSYESMMDWFNTIKKLTSASNPLEKARLVSEKLNMDKDTYSVSRFSQSNRQSLNDFTSSVEHNTSVLQTPKSVDANHALSEATGNTTLNTSATDPTINKKMSQLMTPKIPRMSSQYSLKETTSNIL